MPTYTDITYHIVFGTKHRVRVLHKSRRNDLFQFITGILTNHRCQLYRIGGVEDHLHILTSLHPSLALADLIKTIKTAASDWIKGHGVFPAFNYWQEGYGAFTTNLQGRPPLIAYIQNQEEHHRIRTFTDELHDMVKAHGLKWHPDHLP